MKGYFFDGIDENIIHREDSEKEYNAILTKWADHFHELKRKGLVPLFITGAGVSMDVETNGGKKIPNIYGIIDLLEKEYEKVCKGQPECKVKEVDELFQTLKELKKEDKKDRSTVARLLNAFQENKNKTLEGIWKEFNDQLVNIIIDTKRSPFHENIANIHRKYGAVTLTLNFDGLLIREFEQYGDKKAEKAFSLPTKEECENYFLRQKNETTIKEFLEIQIRGDIFYVKCDSDGFCPQKRQPHSLWAFIASYPRTKDSNEKYDANFLRKCHACGKPGKSFLSFPGSYDKEKSMREMLEIVWKYLSFRIGSVTVTGFSGEWDPLLIAFLGDLLTERDVPMLVIDKEPKKDGKCKYIVEELVNPNIHDAKALGVEAGIFIKDLTDKLNQTNVPNISIPSYKIDLQDDKCWSDIFDNNLFPPDVASKIRKLSQFEIDLISMLGKDRLDKISQLGLKSYWLEIDQIEQDRHNRFHHSLGVMKIASYLYDSIAKQSKIDNPHERQFLRIAALLHDIGHLPFSHLIESVFNELNWKPADYKARYSHEFQTEKRIDNLFENVGYHDSLRDIGYTVDDLKRLINGCFGVGYLDAIINSPIDSDKIDYIFRDTQYTKRKIFIEPVQFLRDISNGLAITPEKFLYFSGSSAMAAAQLVEARQHLYKHLYFQPGIVILEGIVKLLIKTFFVHTIDLHDDVFINNRMKWKVDDDYPDLGEYKINYCIDKLRSFMNEIGHDGQCEIALIDKMYEDIEKIGKHLNSAFMDNIMLGYKLLHDTKGNEALNKIEKKILHRRIKYNREKISEIVRDVSFRFPSAAIIEAIAPPQYLSTSQARKKRERSDGTNTISECIIVPQGDYHLWNPAHLPSKSIHDSSLNEKGDDTTTVFLYPLSGDSENGYFNQAVNLFDKTIEQKALSGE